MLDIFAEKTFIATARENVNDTHDSASGFMISSIKAEIRSTKTTDTTDKSNE